MLLTIYDPTSQPIHTASPAAMPASIVALDQIQHMSQTHKSTECSSQYQQQGVSSRTQSDQQRLASLAIAGVMLALIVILIVRNLDRYEDLNISFRYSELTDLVEPIKELIEVAILSASAVDLNSFESGIAGLPEEVLASEQDHGISVIDGRIIATWMKDESDLDGVTYILTPKIDRGEVKWAVTGTCSEKKAC